MVGEGWGPKGDGVCLWAVYGPVDEVGREFEDTKAGVHRMTSFFMGGIPLEVNFGSTTEVSWQRGCS